LNDLTGDVLRALADERGLGVTSGQRGRKANLIKVLQPMWIAERRRTKKKANTTKSNRKKINHLTKKTTRK
jgi:hypothetical protein